VVWQYPRQPRNRLSADVSQRRHSLRLRDALLRLTHMKLRRLQRIIAREVIVIRQVLGRQMVPLQVREPPEQRPGRHVQFAVTPGSCRRARGSPCRRGRTPAPGAAPRAGPPSALGRRRSGGRSSARPGAGSRRTWRRRCLGGGRLWPLKAAPPAGTTLGRRRPSLMTMA
jgi:hypothetical protein